MLQLFDRSWLAEASKISTMGHNFICEVFNHPVLANQWMVENDLPQALSLQAFYLVDNF